MAASLRNCILRLSRLMVRTEAPAIRTFMTQQGPAAFRYSPVLCGEPMKKRKRVDANLVVQRELKKKRRLEKAIRKLVEKGRHLKPCEEIEGDRYVLKTLEGRDREPVALSFETSEERALLQKDWTRYKYAQHTQMFRDINKAVNAQQRALEELRAESEELYQQAIQIDPDLIPFERKGPLATPPIENYDAPDGDYIDTTKQFDK